MTLEVDGQDLEETLPPPAPADRPHSMAGVVALLIGTLGIALDSHLRKAYLLGAARAGVTDPQPIELGNLDQRLELQHQYLESGFAGDLLASLDAAADVDDIDEAFASLDARAEMYAGAAWSMYQAGFKDFGRSGQLVDFVGPDDERTCGGCQAAVEGGPYALELAPEPGGQDCGTRCRHELIPVTDGEL